MYELLARTDCENAQPAEEPRRLPTSPSATRTVATAITRTSACGFDHNRDFGTQNQIENNV